MMDTSDTVPFTFTNNTVSIYKSRHWSSRRNPWNTVNVTKKDWGVIVAWLIMFTTFDSSNPILTRSFPFHLQKIYKQPPLQLILASYPILVKNDPAKYCEAHWSHRRPMVRYPSTSTSHHAHYWFAFFLSNHCGQVRLICITAADH